MSKGSNKAVSGLFKAARQANKWNILLSGSPTKIANHYKNVTIGKTMSKEGIWKKPKFWG